MLSPYLLRNGKVDFKEFMSMMTEMMDQDSEEEDVRQAFKVFDKDGDGLITAEEIRQTMRNLGEEVEKNHRLHTIVVSLLRIIPLFSCQRQRSKPW